MTPVRKSYLNSYKHDIVYIDTEISVETAALAPEHIRQVAFNDGHTLSRDAADQWSGRLGTRDYRAAMLNILRPGTLTPLEALPPFARKLMYLQHREASSMFANAGLGLVTRGFDIRTWSDWRAVLKYRFVDIAARSGIRANYAERLREAEAITLPEADTVIYWSRSHPTEFPEGQVVITHAISPGASKSAPN
jgi:hypothetical protein